MWTGTTKTCHVLGNALYTVYHTRPGGTRQDVLAVLWGQEPVFRWDADARAWLAATTLSRAIQERLTQVLPAAQDLTADELTQTLASAGLTLTPQQRQQVWDALAIAAYHAQTAVPIVRQLLSDDAAVYHFITDDHALCWVHDGRHYAKLAPVVAHHQALLAAFRKDYWAYYRRLVAYRAAPTSAARDQLRADVATLIERRTGYQARDERLAKTASNAEMLLLVLEHPAIPLHNNDMELAARRRVRKRDVSFGPQSRAGAQAWDTFQTLAATAAKLGVGLYHYLRDRCLHPATTPSLADCIRMRAHSRPA